MYTHHYANGCWTVGTGTVADKTFCPVSDHNSEEEAAAKVASLNGSDSARIAELEQRIAHVFSILALHGDRIETLENPEDPSEYDHRPLHLKPVWD